MILPPAHPKHPVRPTTAAWALITAMACAGACATSPPTPPPAPMLSPAQQARLATLRAELAETGGFYLELSVSEKRVRLCHSGISLAEYPCQDIRLGRAGGFGVFSSPPGPWLLTVWPDVRLDPPLELPRPRLGPTAEPADPNRPPESAPAPPPPPTLAEIAPVPDRFALISSGALRLEVHLDGPIPGAVHEGMGWTDRLVHWLAGLGLTGRDRIVIRLDMPAPAGAALYRCLPGPLPLLTIP